MVEWKTVGDVIEYLPGGALKRSEVMEKRLYPVMNGGVDYSGYYENYNYDENVLTISHWGSSASHVHRHFDKFWANNACWVFLPKDNSKCKLEYLYYILKSREQIMMQTMCFGGATPNLNRSLFEKMPIPIPTLSEQIRIVDILDTFMASIENLKQQIEERRKQYEYYRDQLLDLEGKEGVEMKPLGVIGEFIRGSGIQKADFVEIGMPCIHYGQIHTRYGMSATETFSNIDKNLYNKCKKAECGDVVLATTSEDAEGCAKPVVWLGNEKVAVSGDAYIYHHNQNGKFMAHQFATHRFLLFKIMNATGAKVVRISGENMAKYEIALPSLEEQNRIVSILDTFEAIIANLEAQLEQREKQYEYYRNKLLTFE